MTDPIFQVLNDIREKFQQMCIPFMQDDGSFVVIVKDRKDEQVYALQLRLIKSNINVGRKCNRCGSSVPASNLLNLCDKCLMTPTREELAQKKLQMPLYVKDITGNPTD